MSKHKMDKRKKNIVKGYPERKLISRMDQLLKEICETLEKNSEKSKKIQIKH